MKPRNDLQELCCGSSRRWPKVLGMLDYHEQSAALFGPGRWGDKKRKGKKRRDKEARAKEEKEVKT